MRVFSENKSEDEFLLAGRGRFGRLSRNFVLVLIQLLADKWKFVLCQLHFYPVKCNRQGPGIKDTGA